MSYLPTGTTYSTQRSNIAPGLASGGQDYAAQTINGTGNLTYVAGTSNLISTSVLNHNFSGSATYLLQASGATPQRVVINDVNGNSKFAAITVSGVANNGITINGSNSLTISGNNATVTLYNWSGNAWNAYPKNF
jgi:hypothetical protein